MSFLNQLKNQAKALQTQRTEQDSAFMCTAEHERGFVNFRLLNTTGFQVAQAPYPAARVNHDVLDELARRQFG